jgi:HPt (histidine-containing phosphotransfer) domain-containing protein
MPLTTTLPIDDPEFREIVEEFVVRLEEQLGSARAAWERGDWAAVADIAHWIKGAGGTAGFPALTNPAAALQRLARQDQSGDEMAHVIGELERLFSRIQLPLSV